MTSPNNSASPEVSKKTGTFISFDGTPIYYELRGHGRPVFLCYGLACLINHWTHQIRYFSHGYQTIAVDYRGHHGSGLPANRENLTIDAICKDLLGLMDHLDLKNASFWGHSFGVQVLLRFYDLYPERVSNFVFINGFAKNPIRGLFGYNAVPVLLHLFKEGYLKHPAAMTALWRASMRNPLAIPVSSLVGGFNLNLTSLKNIEVYARGVAGIDLEVFIHFFEQMLSYNGEAVLDRISVPTLVISGSRDGVTPRDRQELLQSQIRDSQFLSVPYGSHCTQLDLPDFVNLRVEKFLDETGYLPTPDRSPTSEAKPTRPRRRPWAAGSLTED